MMSEFFITFSHFAKQMTSNRWKEASPTQLKYVAS